VWKNDGQIPFFPEEEEIMKNQQVPSIPDLLTKIAAFIDAVEVKECSDLGQKKEVAEMAVNVLFCMTRPYYSRPHPPCMGGIPKDEIGG
jgi:hypothetical protein